VPAVLETKAPPGVVEGGPRILIAWVRLDAPLPRRLESVLPIVEAALLQQLQTRGARVGIVYAPDALTLWNETVRSVAPSHASGADLIAIADAFGKSLAQGHAFDALLLPSLAVRHAEVSDQHASWDGVRRPAPGARGERARGLSLHLIALKPSRWRPQERWGGLELDGGAAPLADPARVAEGVALVLDPIWPSIAE
jgi:hypothetical protein